ncbi:MAG: ATP-dependent 6-phosphofructokinase [Leptospiraceae bacterium]|nr:ATP-dependent 6-phosphofructokinase [Leptospiraceae bacterium]
MKSTKIDTLGECTFPSPARYRNYIKEKTVVLYKAEFSSPEEFLEYHNMEPVYFEKSGPSEKIYFDPMWISCGIVTCGGLCPGINDVIRSIVMELTYRYGVRRILGFPFGYQGLVKKYGHKPIELTPNVVSHIHRDGGSFLSSSRGSQDISEMVDYLVEQGIKILFCIGGDGTLKGANAIYEEITRRDKKIAVIGIPKTIDNDINMISKTFGFSTAFSKSIDAIYAADVEANGAPNGIGLVKLMGRHSGYIAVNSALASKDANFVLIPEVDFDLEGEGAFLPTLKQRILSRGHAVIVVAEGAGQKFLQTDGNDPSGNKKLGDIGKFMRDKIIEYFHEKNIPVNLKYIDPSYIIRSMPANPEDSVYCGFLAQNAVHAGMAGKTGMVVGMWNNIYTNLPISLAVSERKVLRPETSDLWRTVLASTGQPDSMLSRASL